MLAKHSTAFSTQIKLAIAQCFSHYWQMEKRYAILPENHLNSFPLKALIIVTISKQA
ncbi:MULTISPECIES: hypothetical protein [unclassified Nostoc]|uniref:hypothetical protein n=1 Tax=unclassified Nostoc TaxID=2593658 RepID=UPI002238E7A5|nr:hypothetical protein [Nostoc sp. KVJ3]MCW5318007.1 hypothetical protein [Nostoc sp. KVJ3]